MVIFENDNFIVDYNPNSRLMRVSYFEDYHYKDEATFSFIPRCIGCEYLDKKGHCMHPDASYCTYGELYWPSGKSAN